MDHYLDVSVCGDFHKCPSTMFLIGHVCERLMGHVLSHWDQDECSATSAPHAKTSDLLIGSLVTYILLFVFAITWRIGHSCKECSHGAWSSRLV